MRPANSEVERLLSDNSLARELVHWHPALEGKSGLREGLRHEAGHERQQRRGKRESDRQNLKESTHGTLPSQEIRSRDRDDRDPSGTE